MKGYDYGQAGAYFVTICTHARACRLGRVVDGEMQLNAVGMVAAERWMALPNHHPGIELDAFVVMPNHIHGIVVLVGTTPALSGVDDTGITDDTGIVPTGLRRGLLGTVIGSYKSSVSRHTGTLLQAPRSPLWQARYHDHIIRDEEDLRRIQEYIRNNPARWAEDRFYTGSG